MASNAGGGNGERDDGPPEVSFPHDTLYRLVSRPERREVLAYLDARGDDASVEELARVVAARRNGDPVGDVREREWRAVRTSLVHVHLPKLRNGGLVEWDRETGRVRSTPEGRRVHVEALVGGDRR
jgi:predicted transcriptional regulator